MQLRSRRRTLVSNQGFPLRIILTAYVRFANALAWHAGEVAYGLHERGHEVMFLCQKESPLAERLSQAAFAVNDRFNLHDARPDRALRALSEIRRALREFRPDVLNPHCPPGHTYLAAARGCEKMRMPLIRTVADPRPPKANPLNSHLHRRLTQGIAFTTSASLKRYQERFQLAASRVRTILPGFRADDFRASVTGAGYRARFGLRDEQVMTAVVARMSPEKGQEILLHALALLSVSERRQVFCVLAGEDTRERGRHDLVELAKRLGVEKQIAFAGWLDDVRPLMAELDLAFITSTRSEAVCRVALEYMSFGVPVIASDVNILPEVIHHGENGWTYGRDDAPALAECLRQALRDPEERRRRGRHGYEMVRGIFGLNRELDETLDFFEELRHSPWTNA
jgi:glycosyltransferase involved in cell wall biosynthesis